MAVETFNINFTTTGKNILLGGAMGNPFRSNDNNHKIKLIGGVVGVGDFNYTEVFQFGSATNGSVSMTTSKSINITQEDYELDRIEFTITENATDVVYAEIVFIPARVFEFGGVVNINSVLAAITDAF